MTLRRAELTATAAIVSRYLATAPSPSAIHELGGVIRAIRSALAAQPDDAPRRATWAPARGASARSPRIARADRTPGAPVLVPRATSLEGELLEVARTVLGTERGAQRVVARLGWDGGGGAFLDDLGRRFGVSRERVRQHEERLSVGLSFWRVEAPILERCLTLVCQRLPAPASALAQALAEAGLTQATQFRLEGLREAARLLRGGAPFQLLTIGREQVALPLDVPSLGAVRRAVQVKLRGRPILTPEDIVAALAPGSGAPGPDPAVVRVLLDRADVTWLDRDQGQFTRPSAWVTLRRRIFRMLAVAGGALHLDQILSGLRREHRVRTRGEAPSRAQLTILCRSLAGLRVEGDRVTADPIPECAAVLAPGELALAEALQRARRPLRAGELLEIANTAGMSEAHARCLLNQSPIFRRIPRQGYVLCGWAPRAAPARRARSSRRTR